MVNDIDQQLYNELSVLDEMVKCVLLNIAYSENFILTTCHLETLGNKQ